MGPLVKRRWDKHTFAVFKRFEPDLVPKGIDIHGDGFAEWRQARRIGYAGLQLFDLLVATVAESDNSQKGDLKRLVRVLEPDAGTQASVFREPSLVALRRFRAPICTRTRTLRLPPCLTSTTRCRRMSERSSTRSRGR